MPQAMAYFPPGTRERRDLDLAGTEERNERTRQYNIAKKYFLGDHDPQLNKKDGEPDDNIVMNMTKMAVERLSSFLFPDMPRFELNSDQTEETDDERWLRECFEDNGGLHFLHEVAETSALMGHVYVRVRPPNMQTLSKYPRFLNVDPRKIITFWSVEDKDIVVFHEIRWQIGQRDYYIQDFVFDETRWIIYTYHSTGGSSYELTEEPKIWNYPQGPIVHWPHLPSPNEFYGRGEFLPSDKKMQDSINLMYSQMARIARYHSSPRTIFLGVEAESIKPTAIDRAWAIENKDADVKNLEMSSDLQAARTIAEEFANTYLLNKRVVVLRGHVKDFQRVTNTGVRMVFIDMIAKNIVLLSIVKRGLQELAHRATIVSNDFSEPLIPDVIVRDPLPRDMKEIADIMAIERSMGTVSKETASTELGHHWPTEDQKIRAERSEEDVAMVESANRKIQADPLLEVDNELTN